jgi:hypothetical protein
MEMVSFAWWVICCIDSSAGESGGAFEVEVAIIEGGCDVERRLCCSEFGRDGDRMSRHKFQLQRRN